MGPLSIASLLPLKMKELKERKLMSKFSFLMFSHDLENHPSLHFIDERQAFTTSCL